MLRRSACLEDDADLALVSLGRSGGLSHSASFVSKSQVEPIIWEMQDTDSFMHIHGTLATDLPFLPVCQPMRQMRGKQDGKWSDQQHGERSGHWQDSKLRAPEIGVCVRRIPIRRVYAMLAHALKHP